MQQEQMIAEIMDFLGKHRESTASIAVYRRIVGDERERLADEDLARLEQGLSGVRADDMEACYYLIK